MKQYIAHFDRVREPRFLKDMATAEFSAENDTAAINTAIAFDGIGDGDYPRLKVIYPLTQTRYGLEQDVTKPVYKREYRVLA